MLHQATLLFVRRKAGVLICLVVLASILPAQNVFVVVVDGVRYSETFGAGNTHIPYLYDSLRSSGCLYTNFNIDPVGKTETVPGHASILSGTWQQILNDGTQHPTKPTLGEYYRKQLGKGMTDAYIVTGKVKLNCLSYSTDADHGTNYRAATNCADVSNNAIYDSLLVILDRYHPQLVLINLPDADRQGHAGSWSGYLQAVRNADSLIYRLWQRLQTDAYYQNTTTLFVTGDHGRHSDNYTSHGDTCEGCRHLTFFAVGRSVRQGGENSDPHYQIDIAPTIAQLLGISASSATGTSLFEGSNPLPIEVAAFRARAKEHDVELTWRTVTETNSFGFSVERSAASAMRWSQVGFVAGSGASVSSREYTFTDRNLAPGAYCYRLRHIDQDGLFSFSDQLTVQVPTVMRMFGLSQNYPNPCNPSTHIRYQLPASASVVLKVFDVLGREIETLVNERQSAGDHFATFNAANLPSGAYFFRLEAGKYRDTKKLFVLK